MVQPEHDPNARRPAVLVRLDDADLDAIEAAAEKLGMRRAEFIRIGALAKVDEPRRNVVVPFDNCHDLERVERQARAVGLGVADYLRSVALADAGAAEASAVRVMFDDKEFARAERAARHRGESLSAYVRSQVVSDGMRLTYAKPPVDGGDGDEG